MNETGWTEAELRATSISTVERMRKYIWVKSYVAVGKEPIFETIDEMAEEADMEPDDVDAAPEWVRAELARRVRGNAVEATA